MVRPSRPPHYLAANDLAEAREYQLEVFVTRDLRTTYVRVAVREVTDKGWSKGM